MTLSKVGKQRSRRRISQREAKAWKKRAEAAEARLSRINNAYTTEWPNGVNIATSELPLYIVTAIDTSRRLGHAVFCTVDGSNVRFYGVRSGL